MSSPSYQYPDGQQNKLDILQEAARRAALRQLQGEPMSAAIDQKAIDLLNGMRVSRDQAAQYREVLNDEAFQFELAAQAKRSLAKYMETEINEGVPIATDKLVDPVTTSTTTPAA